MADVAEKQKKQSFRGKNGGARPGAGRPKGSQNKETKEVRAAQREMIGRILKHLHPILDSQLSLARGVSYLYRIDKKLSSALLVTDPDEIKRFLDEKKGKAGAIGDSYYYITTKTPDLRAIDSLLDRTFGKPKQTTELDLPLDLPFNLTITQKK